MSDFEEVHIEIVALSIAAEQMAKDPHSVVVFEEDTYDPNEGEVCPAGSPDRFHYRALARERMSDPEFDMSQAEFLVGQIEALDDAIQQAKATQKYKRDNLRTF